MVDRAWGYNILDSGISPTGSSDGAAALQSWLNGLPDGATVMIPNGTYLLQSSIRWKKNNFVVHCESVGGVLFDANLGANTSAVFEFRQDTLNSVGATDAQHCVAYGYWFGGTIDRDATNGSCIDIDQCRHYEWVKMHLIRGNHAVRMRASSATTNSGRQYNAGGMVMYCTGTLLRNGIQFGQDPDFPGTQETNRCFSLHNFWEGTNIAGSAGEDWYNGHGNVSIGGLRANFDYGVRRNGGSGVWVGSAPWGRANNVRDMGGTHIGIVLGKGPAWANPSSSRWLSVGPPNPGV